MPALLTTSRDFKSSPTEEEDFPKQRGLVKQEMKKGASQRERAGVWKQHAYASSVGLQCMRNTKKAVVFAVAGARGRGSDSDDDMPKRPSAAAASRGLGPVGGANAAPRAGAGATPAPYNPILAMLGDDGDDDDDDFIKGLAPPKKGTPAAVAPKPTPASSSMGLPPSASMSTAVSGAALACGESAMISSLRADMCSCCEFCTGVAQSVGSSKGWPSRCCPARPAAPLPAALPIAPPNGGGH